jgi:hypothetical protein
LRKLNNVGRDTLSALSLDCMRLKETTDQAKAQVKDLTVFDPENLEYLRQEYSLLALTHLWRPLCLHKSKQVWVYDGLIELTLDKIGKVYHPSISFSNESQV